jgi:hypothetical protein
LSILRILFYRYRHGLYITAEESASWRLRGEMGLLMLCLVVLSKFVLVFNSTARDGVRKRKREYEVNEEK